ncbi:NACHT domain-containing protein [Spirillospora sp. NPDC029432]|uniref:NACHT domain-containing protein n=1 Tax=Spirillospora sp. NPDC029432 TaxID=3154599 RepID=UPI003452BAE2
MKRIALWGGASVVSTVAVAVASNQVLDEGRWNWAWAVPALAVALLGFVAAQRLAAMQERSGIDGARRVLADRVREQWEREIRIRQLDDPAPLAVRWRPAEPGLADDAEYVLPEGADPFTGRADRVHEMAARFRELPRRRLVIVGKPGMGKTTLAVLLLRRLLNQREADGPVPVLFSLTSWDPDRQEYPDWLAAQLLTAYPGLGAAAFGEDAPRALVAGHHVLPVLDGLDELPGPQRPKVIEKLNAALTEDDGLIITCRADEYVIAVEGPGGDVLNNAAVIEPEPLDRADAAAYLRRCLPRRYDPAWDELIATITLTSPLDLWLLRKTYIDTRADPAPLAVLRPSELTGHLLDHVVEALITSNPPGEEDDRHPFRPRRAWRPDRAERWLALLARGLDAAGEHDITWWRLSGAFPARRTRRVAKAAGTAAVGALLALPAVAIAGAVGGLTPPESLSVAVSAFVSGWLGGILGASERDGPRGPSPASLRPAGRWGALAGQLTIGCLSGVVGGLILGLLLMVPVTPVDRPEQDGAGLEPAFEYAPGLWFHVDTDAAESTVRSQATLTGAGWSLLVAAFAAAGLLLGLIKWAMTPAADDRPRDPPAALRRDLGATALVLGGIAVLGAVVGLVGVAIGVVMEAAGAGGDRPMVNGVLMSAVILGAVAGFVGGSRAGTASMAYLAALAGLRGRLPWRLLAFLEDAHRLGLLRRAGPVYQFRHARLLEYFAARGRDASRRSRS